MGKNKMFDHLDDAIASRYEVLQQLAKKAGRRTLLARDLETQELVVIKLLSFSSDFEWDDLKLFEREAKTLKTITHPAIPLYLDYFELNSPNGKGFALVQTYIPAKSLEEHLKGGRTFSEAEVKQIAKSLLDILTALHERQPPIIHRDIKPSNILLSDRSGNSAGDVYLVDFGSVQTLAAKENGTITVVGTYGYMPPEQFGDRTVPASDLYSLGATLITLATGTHPADLPHKDGEIQFEQLTQLSPNFTRWLKLITKPSLDRRLSSAKLALQALDEPPPSIDLNVISRPSDSKVLLNKTANLLEIILPARGFHTNTAHAVFLSSLISVFVVPLTAITFYIFPVFFIFLLPLWLIDYSLIRAILNSFFGRIRLKITPKRVTLTREFLGWNYQQHRSAKRKDVSLLMLRYGFDGKRQEIVIWAGRKTITFGEHELTEPELEWLAQELSNCLKMPIKRESRAFPQHKLGSRD